MSRGIAMQAEVLGLLAAEVSEAELLAALAVLRAEAGDDAALLAAVARLEHDALALHRARLEDRHRAQALVALSDTAADLATHRDLDALLAAICRRARALLGTDVAYITLGDPAAGDTYVRATDGIVSEALRSMRLPMGVGLGGLVAATGRPEMTADYGADDRLAHVRDVDARVEAEGLRAIVGVPLRRGEQVLGVVMSGSRTPRRFEPQEVARFASLAAHAAIALENARLLEDARAALEELAEAHQALRDRADRVERLGAIQEALAVAALRGAGVEELLQTVVDALGGGELTLLDPDGAAQARVGAAPPGGDTCEAAVVAGAEPLGTLRLCHAGGGGRGRRDGIETEVLAQVAVPVAGILFHQRMQSEAEHRHRSGLLAALIEGDGTSDEELRRAFSRAGLTLDGAHLVLVLDHGRRDRWSWLTAARAAVAEHGFVGSLDDRLVVVLPGGDPAAADRWADLLRSDAAPTIGVATTGADGGIGALRVALREAGGAVNVLLALDRPGQTAGVAELGLFGHLLHRPARPDLLVFVDRTLGPVLAHDAEGAGPLLPTLEAYFAQAGHLANVARDLGVHINTLYRRLDRLDGLLGPDWRTPDRRLELHLALRLRALDAQLGER